MKYRATDQSQSQYGMPIQDTGDEKALYSRVLYCLALTPDVVDQRSYSTAIVPLLQVADIDEFAQISIAEIR